MAETSGFHTTNAAGAGHQVANYTESMMQIAMTIIAACHGRVGIAPDYEDELAPTDGGANTVDVAAGGAMVDGMWYNNSASEAVNIPSAGGGTVRYDRLELIHTGTPTFTVVITRTPGTALAPPAATAGAVTICTVVVDDAGAVTVTDARVWATRGVIVRQGGHATEWKSSGTTTYTPTTVRMQVGSISITASSAVTITFPQAFSAAPIVVYSVYATEHLDTRITVIDSTSVEIANATAVGGAVFWLAIGPI